jgi:hypothetical protein
METAGRSGARSSLAVGGGILAAVVLVAAVALSGRASVVLVPSGTHETVPAFLNGTAQEGGLAECQQHDNCGHAGVLEITFDLAGPAALTGTFDLPSDLTIALANAIGLTDLAVGWWWPAGNGTTEAGGETWEASGLTGTFDLGSLQFGLDGPNNVVPAGTWTLCFVNWGPQPAVVAVTGAMSESPR